jgi:hypothetical protein
MGNDIYLDKKKNEWIARIHRKYPGCAYTTWRGGSFGWDLFGKYQFDTWVIRKDTDIMNSIKIIKGYPPNDDII